jgi:hypothetical protein
MAGCGEADFAGLLLPLGHGQLRGPQWPEKRLGNNPADDGEGRQDQPDLGIERNSILAGHITLQPSHITNNVDGSNLVANDACLMD